MCHRRRKCWWLVKLGSWSRRCGTVIRREQVMLYLSRIFTLCSNSLSDAEEPSCSVTLIKWYESSSASVYGGRRQAGG